MGDQREVFELYQAEWCPYSAQVRQRLTELEMDVILRQVEPEPEERDRLFEATRQREIPALLLADGTVVAGHDAILELLGDEIAAPREAQRHRAQARAHAR
jgi:glutathione S-transferase